jgi:hypothetical protein
LLIAAGDSVSEFSDLPVGVRSLVEGASEIVVMSPSLTGRLHWLTGDNSRARHVADDRLETVLGQLENEGVEASGVRGDEVPRTAFSDAIRQFAPDHILIALRGATHRGWQDRGLLDHLVRHFGLPVTVFVIDA